MEGGIWGIVIIVAAFMIQFFAFGTTASIGVYNIELLDYFNDATVGVSLISALNFGMFLGSGPIVSLLMTKFTYRKIAIFGSFLVVLGLLGMPLFPYLPLMCISFGVLSGFGSCCVYIPSHVLSGLYYDKYRSLATGVATSGSGLGNAVMPVIVGSLIDFYTWKGSFIFLAGLCLHLIVFSALLRKPPTLALEEKVCPGNSTELENSPKQIDADPSHCQLFENSMKEETINFVESSNGRDFAENHDFESVNMNELEFIDKLSWRPGAGFVSTENIFVRDEKGIIKSLNSSPANNGHCSNNDRNNKDCEDDESLKTETPPASDLCDDKNLSKDAYSPQLIEQKEDNEPKASSAFQKETNLSPNTSKHFYVFTDYCFDVYFLNNLLWNFSCSILQSFVPEFLKVRGFTPMDAAWMIGGYGAGTFIGGILGGVGGNLNCINRIVYFTLANLCMGVCITLLPVFHDVVLYNILLVVCGISFGILLGLLIVVLTDLIGIESLGNGLGYLMLANGLGTFSGPPIAGLLYSATGGFDVAIYVAGACCILSGLVMLLIPLRPCIQRS